MNQWVMPATAIVSAVSSLLSAVIYYKTLRVSIDSLQISAQAYEKQLDARFEIKYAFPGMEEYASITNLGNMDVRSIILRRISYFISRDEIITFHAMQNRQTDLQKIVSSGIIRNPCDIKNISGPYREFEIAKLDKRDSSNIEVSHAENNNAIRVAELLGYIYVVEWNVKYLTGPDDHIAIQNFFFWEAAGNTREELSDVIGGAGVVQRIRDAEDHSTDELFGTTAGKSLSCF